MNPSEWHKVAALSDLDPDFPLGVEISGQKIGVYRIGDAVHAIEDICPHAFALLSQGFVEGGVIECPLHAARFDIATGKCLDEIGQRDLSCHATRVEHGEVWIRVEPSAS